MSLDSSPESSLEQEISEVAQRARELALKKEKSKAATETEMTEVSQKYVDLLAQSLAGRGYGVRKRLGLLSVMQNESPYWVLEIVSAPEGSTDAIINWARRNGGVKTYIDPFHDSAGSYSELQNHIYLAPRGWERKFSATRAVLYHEVRHHLQQLRLKAGIDSIYHGGLYAYGGANVRISKVEGYESYFAFDELWTYYWDLNYAKAAYLKSDRKDPALKKQIVDTAGALRAFGTEVADAMARVIRNIDEPGLVGKAQYFELKQKDDLTGRPGIGVVVQKTRAGRVLSHAQFDFPSGLSKDRAKALPKLIERVEKLRAMALQRKAEAEKILAELELSAETREGL